MKPLRALLAILPFVLGACASPGAPAGQPAQSSYTLQPGQRIDLGGQASIAYDSFSDSRCPESMKCMWAGELTYRLTLHTGAATEQFSLGPSKPGYVSQALGGARIALDPAKLPPVPPAGVAPANYPVTVSVTRP